MRNIKINTEVTLISSEASIAKKVGEKRQVENDQVNVVSRKKGWKSEVETNIAGVSAEFAFCKLFNIFPDMTTTPRSKEVDKGDAMLPNGMTVDVKTTHLPNGTLMCPNYKADGVIFDLYALMVGEHPSFIFKGFIRGKDFFSDKYLTRILSKGSGGYNWCYKVEQKDLLTLEEIEELIRVETSVVA
jgi:hypothetical protein